MRALIAMAVAAALSVACTAGAAQESAAPATPTAQGAVEVMVLGTYHFSNPGLDVVNVKADNVLAPRRQRELEALAGVLAAFNPTKIVVERQAEGPSFAVPSYREFRPEMLAGEASERVQIAYRLAHRLGHEDVYGFDEQPGEGEPSYFPFGAVQKYAAEHDQTEIIAAIMARVQKMASKIEQDQESSNIAELLQTQNRRDELAEGHGFAYYGLLAVGDGERQPGAELNAYWFMRNAKMFAKLGLIAEPGDRVLVVVGGGHKYWLDHFAEMTPGYRPVDSMPYLERAAVVIEAESAAAN